MRRSVTVNVVVAPAAFKGTLSAVRAADAIAVGVARVLPDAQIERRPMADGGDGSVDALVAAGHTSHRLVVAGPTGVRHEASIATHGSTAIVELANTCGLSLLPDGVRAPMTASTFGLGEAISFALDNGADRIVICLGGSASTDGGAGMVSALGARVLDNAGHPVHDGGQGLAMATRLELSGLDPRLRSTEFVVAADVTSPLFGPRGAAHVFAPQKGASSDEVEQLDDSLRNWSRLLAAATGRDVPQRSGAGAAGGAASAAMAVLGAEVVSGATFIHEAIGLTESVARADLVVTGEGRLDEQSLLGKGPVEVARLCTAAGVPVVAVCGQITLDDDAMRRIGFAAWSAVVA